VFDYRTKEIDFRWSIWIGQVWSVSSAFPIAIETIECWILPFYAPNKAQQKKHVNCLKALNPFLLRKHGFTIDKNCKYQYFDKAAKPLKDHRLLRGNFRKNPSLEIFIEEVDTKFKFL